MDLPSVSPRDPSLVVLSGPKIVCGMQKKLSGPTNELVLGVRRHRGLLGRVFRCPAQEPNAQAARVF